MGGGWTATNGFLQMELRNFMIVTAMNLCFALAIQVGGIYNDNEPKWVAEAGGRPDDASRGKRLCLYKLNVRTAGTRKRPTKSRDSALDASSV